MASCLSYLAEVHIDLRQKDKCVNFFHSNNIFNAILPFTIHHISILNSFFSSEGTKPSHFRHHHYCPSTQIVTVTCNSNSGCNPTYIFILFCCNRTLLCLWPIESNSKRNSVIKHKSNRLTSAVS